MNQLVEIIIIIASVITALGTIIGCFTTIHKWILRQNKQDEDIRSIKTEQKILTTGVLACLINTFKDKNSNFFSRINISIQM